MSYMIIWGYKTGLTNKKFLGIKPCNNCGKFAERYLAKSFFRINLFWFLPIFGVPTGKYVRCGNCDGVRKLTRAEWTELKESARFMPKKKDYLKAYEELKALVLAAEPDDLTTSTIYNRLLGKIDFPDDGGHIRELVDVYLKNSQNAVSKTTPSASSAVPSVTATGETPALVTENGITREVDPSSVSSVPSSTGAANVIPSSVASTVPSSAVSSTPAGNAKKDSKLRLLWLIPALLLLPIVLFMIAAVISMMGDPTVDAGVIIVALALFVVIPGGLDALFFALACKKKK